MNSAGHSETSIQDTDNLFLTNIRFRFTVSFQIQSLPIFEHIQNRMYGVRLYSNKLLYFGAGSDYNNIR